MAGISYSCHWIFIENVVKEIHLVLFKRKSSGISANNVKKCGSSMTDKSVEKIVSGAVRLLREFFPKSAHLYFPLLSAALIWAMRKPEEWEESILSWQVWPDPDYIETKPNDFILDFFSSHPMLRKAFAKEMRTGDWEALRAAFTRLYPIFGLDDPFLSALFQEEIAAKDFAKIVQDFETRVGCAKKDIQTIKGQPRFFAALRAIADELASLGTTLLVESEVQRSLQEVLDKQLKESDG